MRIFFILRLISSHFELQEIFLFYSSSASIPEWKGYKKFYTWSAYISKYRNMFFEYKETFFLEIFLRFFFVLSLELES